jgi:plasmid stabilization system protein ParE
MPQNAWSPKRERQYEHIKEGLVERGTGEDKAEEIAARTVNKTRAQKGEAKTSSRLSRTDMSPSRRGGLRSGTRRPKGRTKAQLYNEAKRMGIEGRSKMTKEQLQRAVDRRK